MELKEDGALELRGFSPHSLTFLPSVNCFLAVDGIGKSRCLDLASGAELYSTDLSGATGDGSPLLCTVHPATSKLVVASGRRMGARGALSGAVLLNGILQCPAKKNSDVVSIEIPFIQVSPLLKELQSLSSSIKSDLLKSVVRQLEKGLLEGFTKPARKFSGRSCKWSTMSFSGPVHELSELFEDILLRLKSTSNKSGMATALSTSPPSPALPIISAICLRLLLLRPDHTHLSRFEHGEEEMTSNQSKLMYCEAVRKLSLCKWPHKDYVWAVPKAMAAAGFYHLVSANPPAHSLSAKGDRVSCFACRVYLYSWEPTDEPWSEHERHAMQCPFMRGDYTENVPLAVTEGTHPAMTCASPGDSIVSISTSANCSLTAVATTMGHITLWDVSGCLFVMGHAEVDITTELLNKCLGIEPPANADEGEAAAAGTPVVSQHSEETVVVSETNDSTPVVSQHSEETVVVSETNDSTPVVSQHSEETVVVSETNDSTPVVSQHSEETVVVSETNDSTPVVSQHSEETGAAEPRTEEEVDSAVEPKLKDIPVLPSELPTSESSHQTHDSQPLESSELALATPDNDAVKLELATPDNDAVKLELATPDNDAVKLELATPDNDAVKLELATPDNDAVKLELATPDNDAVKLELATPDNDAVKLELATPDNDAVKLELATPDNDAVKLELATPDNDAVKLELATPDNDAVKLAPAIPCVDAIKLDLATDSVTAEPALKQNFHITSLSVLSLPGKAASASPELSLPSPALVSGVTVVTNGRATPLLLIHSIRLTTMPKKGKSQSKAQPPSVPLFLSDDPLMDWPLNIDENMTSFHPVHPPQPAPSNMLDVLESTKSDGAVDSLPACAHFDRSITLDDFSGEWSEGALPEILHIVPLNGGKLLAVSVNCRRLDSSTGEVATSCESPHGGLLVYSVARDSSGHTTIETEPVAELRLFSDSETVISMCAAVDGLGLGCDLLAVVTRGGDVVVYETDNLTPVVRHTPGGDEGRYATCITYCPASGHLAIATRQGKVLLLVMERERVGVNMEQEELKATLDQPLTADELDHFTSLTKVSPEGMSFSGSTPHDWEEISILQYHRRTPIHMHLPQDLGGPGTKVWQYHPPTNGNKEGTSPFNIKPSSQHLFELVPELPSASIGCVSVKFCFANAQCLCENAAVSLLLPKWERLDGGGERFRFKEVGLPPDAELLCGPVKLKTLVDVTGRSAQVSFCHPRLMINNRRVLWLLVEELFTSDYTEVASTSEGAMPGPPPLRRRTTIIKHGMLYRRKPMSSSVPKASLPDQGTVAVTLHPTAALHPDGKLPVLLTLIQRSDFVTQVTLAACGYTIEASEYHSLSGSLQAAVNGFKGRDEGDAQFKALDLLCWITSVNCSNAERQGYAEVVGAVGQLLVSLIYACFIQGNRSLSHKCARLITTLSRSEDSSPAAEHFRTSLSSAMGSLLPLLPLAPSAASMHWFLRLVASIIGSHDSHMTSKICLSLLVELTKQLSVKGSLSSQLLQTHFKQEGSIFEPELYDIYLSYCQKGASKTQQRVLQGSHTFISPAVHLPPPDPLDLPDPVWEGGLVYPATTASAPPVSTHVIADKRSHTIYDSELQLLLDCSEKTDAQAAKAIDEFTTFKHGSFLLYGQRGLLETHPLRYSCVSVSGNATVQEPIVQGATSIPEGVPTVTHVAEGSKTLGYQFPAAESKRGKKKAPFEAEKGTLSQPIPAALADILVLPKEQVMHVDALKSGLAYSAVLKFPYPVALTDISIPTTSFMSSVSVDVWGGEGGQSEAVRVAHSSEIHDKSLMLGNLMPPPLCQYAKVTFVGRLGAAREKAQVYLGSFFGSPLLSPSKPLPPVVFHSLEQRLLSEYLATREKLASSLAAYATTTKKNSPTILKQCETQVTSTYQNCFKAQVRLARLRSFMQNQTRQPEGGVLQLEQQLQLLDLSEMSSSRLYKFSGCLVDTLLVLNDQSDEGNEARHQTSNARSETGQSSSEASLEENGSRDLAVQASKHPPTLTESECSLLFSTLCINGVPKLHARACALLVRLCGSQAWWGRFICSAMEELFSVRQTAVFNKERALLQLSALCQRTYQTSGLMRCLFTTLEGRLMQTSDQHLLQWLVLLFSHVLSSLSLHNNKSNHSQNWSNLFVPMLTVPSDKETAEESLEDSAAVTDSESLNRQRQDLKKTLVELQLKLKHSFGDEKLAVLSEYDKLLQEYREQKKLLISHQRHQRLAQELPEPPTFSPIDVASCSPDPILSSLPFTLCHSVAKGLAHYILVLTATQGWDLIPVTCKCISQLVTLTTHKLPLHSLLDQAQLDLLLAFCCQRSIPHSRREGDKLEWSQRAMECLVVNLLYHGEIAGHDEEEGEKEEVIADSEQSGEEETVPYLELKSEEEENKQENGEENSKSEQDGDQTTSQKEPISEPTPSSPEDISILGSVSQSQGASETEVKGHDNNPVVILGEESTDSVVQPPSDGEDNSTIPGAEAITPVDKDSTLPTHISEGADSLPPEAKPPSDEEDKEQPGDVPYHFSEFPPPPPGTHTVNLKLKKPEHLLKTLKTFFSKKENQGTKKIIFQIDPELQEKPMKKLSKHSLQGKKFAPGDYSDIPVLPQKPGEVVSSADSTQLPYQSFIISNTIDSRLLHSTELPAELALQCTARKVYESVLVALMNARPIPPGDLGVKGEEMSPDQEPNASSGEMLCKSIEQLLEKAMSPQSNIDLVSVLEFWNELNSVSESSGRRGDGNKMTPPLAEKKERLNTCGLPLCSKHMLQLLLDNLLAPSPPCSRMWQLGLSLIHTAVGQSQGYTVDSDQLLDVLVKLFSGGEQVSGTDSIQASSVSTFLVDLVPLCVGRSGLDGMGREERLGVHLLLEVLLTVLENGGSAALTSPTLLSLIDVLGQEDNLRYLWNCTPSGHCYHVIGHVKRLCSAVVSLLPAVVEAGQQPGVVLYGAELEEERRRYRYMQSSGGHDVKWVPVASDQGTSSDSSKVASELIQLVRQLLSMKVPEATHLPLQEYCRNEFDDTTSASDLLSLADPSMPLLVLFYANSSLLTSLLSLLNASSSTAIPPSDDNSGKGNEMPPNLVQNLFCNFVHFLAAHCHDYSCFFQPILEVLGVRRGSMPISKPFMTLVGKLTSELERQGDSEHLMTFIKEGGAKLIFECLVAACKQFQPSSGSFVAQSITKLGQREVLKPYREHSSLVNFLPVSSIKLTPNRTSVRDLKTSGLTNLPSRSSTFHHTFRPDEKWLILSVTLPYPILLHAVQLSQPMGLFQNGPAAVLVECASQSGLASPSPVSPVLNTTGLACIRVEVQRPVVAQEVVVHLHRPLVSNSISLSHMHLLGVGYGSSQRQSDTSTSAHVQDRTHPSTGWLYLVDRWLGLSEDIQEQLMEVATKTPELLNSCLSLLHTEEALSSQSSNHLKHLLLSLAAHSPEHGLTMVQHLLGFHHTHDPAPLPNEIAPVSPVAVELLYHLCLATSDNSSQRLTLALRLLSHISQSPPPSLPPLVRALSSAVWHGNKSTTLDEALFRCLVEAAFSLELGSPLKSAMSSLICALCSHSTDHFSLVLSNCQQVVEGQQPGIAEVLHTLAMAAQSEECTHVLLGSDLASGLVTQLYECFSKFVEWSQEGTELDTRAVLSQACMNLAFLTDLCKHWSPAKDWLGNPTSCKFWSPMVEFLSSNRNLVSAAELAFCQDVACEFIEACLGSHTANKVLFTRLLCNAIQGSYSIKQTPQRAEENTSQLTPFLYRLIVDLVLKIETIPVVLTEQDDTKPSLSFTLTYDSADFHPSFPISQRSYHIHVPVSCSVDELSGLCHSHQLPLLEKTKPPPPSNKKPPPSEPSSNTVNIAKFDVSSWKMLVDRSKSTPRVAESKESQLMFVHSSAPEIKIPHDTEISMLTWLDTPVLLQIRPCAPTGKDSPKELTTIRSPSLLELFLLEGGLQPLADCLPSLYPYHWPPRFSKPGVGPPEETAGFKSHSLLHTPSSLPFHSAVMLGLCLKLHSYGEIIGRNAQMAFTMLRMLLGAELKDSIPKAEVEQLSFLPYLLLLQCLKEHRPSSEEGRDLRRQAFEVGIVHQTLHCLSLSGNHSPRVEERESTAAEPTMLVLSPKHASRVSATTSDKHYWAKGTGFSTGSTTSTWNMEAMLAKQKAEEKYLSLCFAILAEYLMVVEGDPTLQVFHPEVEELLSSSSLLPALAGCLLNDSILDISKHVELYQSVLDLLSSLSTHPSLKHLLMLPVFSPGDTPTTEETSLSSLVTKLRIIADTYQRTIKASPSIHPLFSAIPRRPPPSSKNPAPPQLSKKQEPPAPPPPPPPPPLPPLSKKQDPSAPPLLPRQLRVPITYPTTPDEADLAELISKILATSEKVAAVVREFKEERARGEVEATLRAPESSFDTYMKTMKPVQFDTFQFLEEDFTGKVKFKSSFYYESRVQNATSSATHNAARARRLAQEVATLATSLPLSPSSSVFVRCDEERLDVMKVLITGPSDTPYSNGCFEFDIYFPPDYPKSPMLVNLITTGHGRVRFNPNLYNDGKVCLSVLNTWHGRPEEKWNPHTSSFLQVLVSIQSLILVPEPYFNEPGYEQYRGTPYGDQKTLTYNANIYVATVQWAMINQIRNPSPCFKAVILRHFYLRQKEVVSQCDQWKAEVAEGIRKMQEAGAAIAHLKEFLRTLVKSVDTLKSELVKIKPSDFEGGSDSDHEEGTES